MGKAKQVGASAATDASPELKRGGGGVSGVNRRLLAVLENVPDDGKWYLIETWDSNEGARRAVERYRAGHGWLPAGTTMDDWEFEHTTSRRGGRGRNTRSSSLWARRTT